MILNVLLTIIEAPILALIDLLPHGAGLGLNTLATSIVGSSYWPQLGWANDYFPLDTAITCIELILATAIIMVTLQMATWIYDKIRG